MFERFGLATILVSAVTLSGLAGSAPAFAAEPEGDSIVVLAKHAEAKPTDPVQVKFEKFKVTKASFDPKNLEGAKATLEIDTSSLKTGSDKRDNHLKTPDYLDAKKFATITVDIDKVKKKAGKTYTAEATVNFRDVKKMLPVTFDVVDAKDDWVKIKGEAAFSRFDFNVGGAKDSKTEAAAPDLIVKLALTLNKKA
jgi:polyisoprenoid-binding protein YceI